MEFAVSETPIFDQKYRPILEPLQTGVRDFGVTGMGWAGLAGLAGWFRRVLVMYVTLPVNGLRLF